MELRLILTAFIVCSGSTGDVLSTNQMDTKTVTAKENEGHKNFRNLFDSIIKNDREKTETYRITLQREAGKEQQTFDTMKEKLRFARQRKPENTHNSHGSIAERAALSKRETNKSDEEWRNDYLVEPTKTDHPDTYFPYETYGEAMMECVYLTSSQRDHLYEAERELLRNYGVSEDHEARKLMDLFRSTEELLNQTFKGLCVRLQSELKPHERYDPINDRTYAQISHTWNEVRRFLEHRIGGVVDDQALLMRISNTAEYEMSKTYNFMKGSFRWSTIEKIRFAIDKVDGERAIFPVTVHRLLFEGDPLHIKEILVSALGEDEIKPRRFEIEKLHDFTMPLFEEFQSSAKDSKVPACKAALKDIHYWRVIEALKLDNNEERRRIRPMKKFIMSRTIDQFTNLEKFVPPVCDVHPWQYRSVDVSALKTSNLPVVWVLGGPGSGKGTLCGKIVAKYGFTHISTGDLLRDEVQSGSNRGKEAGKIMKDGGLVPTGFVLTLLAEKLVKELPNSKGFLIDGYPREKAQGELFEENITPADIIIYLEAEDSVMVNRLLHRAKTSERSDDDEEVIKRRLAIFRANNDAIIEAFASKFKKINAVQTPKEVFAEAEVIINAIIAAKE